MLQEHRAYIDAMREVVEVHSTVDESTPLEHVPDYVRNHGVLPGPELHKLLRRAKVRESVAGACYFARRGVILSGGRIVSLCGGDKRHCCTSSQASVDMIACDT